MAASGSARRAGRAAGGEEMSRLSVRAAAAVIALVFAGAATGIAQQKPDRSKPPALGPAADVGRLTAVAAIGASGRLPRCELLKLSVTSTRPMHAPKKSAPRPCYLRPARRVRRRIAPLGPMAASPARTCMKSAMLRGMTSTTGSICRAARANPARSPHQRITTTATARISGSIVSTVPIAAVARRNRLNRRDGNIGIARRASGTAARR